MLFFSFLSPEVAFLLLTDCEERLMPTNTLPLPVYSKIQTGSIAVAPGALNPQIPGSTRVQAACTLPMAHIRTSHCDLPLATDFGATQSTWL